MQLLKEVSRKFSEVSLGWWWQLWKIPSLKSESTKEQMVWISHYASIVFTFCLFESWLRDQSEFTNIFYGENEAPSHSINSIIEA